MNKHVYEFDFLKTIIHVFCCFHILGLIVYNSISKKDPKEILVKHYHK
jgi:hypothetical protein